MCSGVAYGVPAQCSAANLVGLNVLQLMTDVAASELSDPLPSYFSTNPTVSLTEDYHFKLLCLLVCSAAALNYGLFRQASFNTTPQYIMFYDVGALSTTASIIGEWCSPIVCVCVCVCVCGVCVLVVRIGVAGTVEV